MRILHSIRTVDPAAGGPVEGLKQISAVNQKQGHSIEVLSLDDPEAAFIRQFPLRVHAMGPSRLRYGYSGRMVPWLLKNAQNYDALIVNGIWQYNSFGVWQALRDQRTPYFVFTHGMLDPWFKRTYPLKHLKKWLYWPWAEYRVLRDAAAVLFTCEEERRLARESFWLYKCKDVVVNYGTAAPTGDSEAQRELFFSKYEHLRGLRCLLFLGRVHVKKGPDLLFRAFANAIAKDPVAWGKFHIVMAGPNDHAYGREMMSLVDSLGLSSRVTWTGMITGDLKWGAFHAADVFVLPSHQENFGIAVAEALACGVPVLISNQINIWREIEESKAGIVGTDDVCGTEHLLSSWLGLSPSGVTHMRMRAKECFRARFHIEESGRSLMQTVERFVRSSI